MLSHSGLGGLEYCGYGRSARPIVGVVLTAPAAAKKGGMTMLGSAFCAMAMFAGVAGALRMLVALSVARTEPVSATCAGSIWPDQNPAGPAPLMKCDSLPE